MVRRTGRLDEGEHGLRGVDPRRRPVSWLLVAFVRAYQVSLSPLVGGHCRYLPTCSRYFIEAVVHRGAVRGTLMGLWRVCRCHPFARGGYDPVRSGGEKSSLRA